MTRGPQPVPAIERWRKYVEKTETCWIWMGAKQGRGYGRFKVADKILLVHRWTYEWFVGPIPEGLTIDHLCRNPSCVRPDHLEPVTREENSWRGNTNKDKTECLNGHELSGANVYVPPSRPQVRECRICRVDRARARREARTAQPRAA